MVHLRMTGQLLLAPAGAPRPPHTHVVMALSGEPAEELWFVDPRTFGEVVVFDPDHVDVELPELARLGVDPLADGLDAITLQALLAGRRTPAEAAAARPARDRRHRQHLRRRDPPRRPAAPRAASPARCAAAEVAGLHDVMHDVLRGRRRRRRLDARRRPVRRPDGQRRLVPGRPPGLRPGRPALPDVRPRRRSAAPSPPAARRTTARGASACRPIGVNALRERSARNAPDPSTQIGIRDRGEAIR